MRCNVPFRTQHGRQLAGLLTAKKAKAGTSEDKRRKHAIPDEMILDIRAKYEYQGWKIKDIATHHGLQYSAVYRYVNYQTAGNLIPPEPEKQ